MVIFIRGQRKARYDKSTVELRGEEVEEVLRNKIEKYDEVVVPVYVWSAQL